MEYSKANETELKIAETVETVVSLANLKAKRTALENSITTLQAELAVIDTQIAECDKLGIIETK